jgi:hypothetical protein
MVEQLWKGTSEQFFEDALIDDTTNHGLGVIFWHQFLTNGTQSPERALLWHEQQQQRCDYVHRLAIP